MAKDDPKNMEMSNVDFVLVKNYKIKYTENPNKAGHYIPVAEITPLSFQEKKVLGDSTAMVVIPMFSELGNYTDWPIKYNLLLLLQRGRHLWQNKNGEASRFLTDVAVFPVSNQIGDYDIAVGEKIEGFQVLDGSQLPGDNYRVIKSESGNSFIGISDDTIVLRSGDSMVTITPKQMTIKSKTVNLNLPNANYVIAEETGFLSLLPKCFLPIFNTPTVLPKIDLFAAAAKITNIVTSILTKKGG